MSVPMIRTGWLHGVSTGNTFVPTCSYLVVEVVGNCRSMPLTEPVILPQARLELEVPEVKSVDERS